MHYWPKDVTVSVLQARARSLTGLEDFGPDEYRLGLEHLLLSYEENSALTQDSARQCEDALVQILALRLRTQQRLEAFKNRARVEKPWVILCMPRSGTTALHRLLAADPSSQGLEHWLGQHPQARPASTRVVSNPDYQQTVQSLAAFRRQAPEVFQIHEMAADEVDECSLLFKQSFANMGFFQNAGLPRYEEWLWGADLSGAYARHRAMLELIDGGSARRWILKDPSHLMSLDALQAEYPDLRVICLRRPVDKFLPSVSALVFAARQMAEPSVTRETVGAHQLECWSRCAHELVRWRDRNPDVLWCDVELEELRAHPFQALQKVYERLGEPLSLHAKEAIQHKSYSLKAGENLRKPTLGQFGLSKDKVLSAFPEEFH